MAENLHNRFDFHPADEATGERLGHVRSACLDLAQLVESRVPESRERSLALTHLEEVMFWANAAIARHRWVPGGAGIGDIPTGRWERR